MGHEVEGFGAEDFHAIVVGGNSEGSFDFASQAKSQERAKSGVDEPAFEWEEEEVRAFAGGAEFCEGFVGAGDDGLAKLHAKQRVGGDKLGAVARANGGEFERVTDRAGERFGNRKARAGPDGREAGCAGGGANVAD